MKKIINQLIKVMITNIKYKKYKLNEQIMIEKKIVS